MTTEDVAKAFHEAYEQLAPDFNYTTRVESAVPWEKVPEPNRALMTAVAERLIIHDVIRFGGEHCGARL